MTQQETLKCEELLCKAIVKAEQARNEFEAIRKYYITDNMYECEMYQRKSDRHWGRAEGMFKVLDDLGFKHDDMTKLNKLIDWE